MIDRILTNVASKWILEIRLNKLRPFLTNVASAWILRVRLNELRPLLISQFEKSNPFDTGMTRRIVDQFRNGSRNLSSRDDLIELYNALLLDCRSLAVTVDQWMMETEADPLECQHLIHTYLTLDCDMVHAESHVRGQVVPVDFLCQMCLLKLGDFNHLTDVLQGLFPDAMGDS